MADKQNKDVICALASAATGKPIPIVTRMFDTMILPAVGLGMKWDKPISDTEYDLLIERFANDKGHLREWLGAPLLRILDNLPSYN